MASLVSLLYKYLYFNQCTNKQKKKNNDKFVLVILVFFLS